MILVNILQSKTKELIEKRLNQKYSIFKFHYQTVGDRFKNMELGIRNAIVKSNIDEKRIERVKGFNEGIKRVFNSYEKDIYPTYFEKFINYEELLERVNI